MKTRWSVAVFVGCCLALFTLLSSQSASTMSPAEEEAVRKVNQEWFKAYAAGNVNGLVALYADDAVLSNPGVPPARGRDAIREAFVKDVADSRATGVSLKPNAKTDLGISGNLAWEWGIFTVTEKSGATIDKGKYLTVFAKRNGKWLIVRDMWNSDGPMPEKK